jgi:hypothetical protein
MLTSPGILWGLAVQAQGKIVSQVFEDFIAKLRADAKFDQGAAERLRATLPPTLRATYSYFSNFDLRLFAKPALSRFKMFSCFFVTRVLGSCFALHSMISSIIGIRSSILGVGE